LARSCEQRPEAGERLNRGRNEEAHDSALKAAASHGNFG